MFNKLRYTRRFALLGMMLLLVSACACIVPRGTGDLGLIIERASGSVQIIDTSQRTSLARIKGLGDLSHASVVFSRDQRFAYVFGRDGGLNKVDLLEQKLVKRIMQSGNSIGGAISQDGRLVAVSNYTPGGVRVFDADSLALVADIPARAGDGKLSKVVGLVDAPGQRFVFSLYDAGEIWIADFSKGNKPLITKFHKVGKQPYDGLITPDGRYYIAGLFGEDGLVRLDLWRPQAGVKRILDHYGKGWRRMPVYKMPHLEGWAVADQYAFLPAVGLNEVLVVSRRSWKEVTRIAVHGQPVFVMARPDGHQIWVNFAFPNNDTVEVIDTLSLKKIHTLKPGKAVLHMEFTPRGEEVWISSRDDNRVSVYDTQNFKLKARLPAVKPSGIFMTSRAYRIGL
ncbi:Heme d1 biosynthesis protein NirF [hydrothermal vent metagenome]|uniref:Heme d1 biosynthesis protein NirF n=1 Tax=hydrothermal vent metagenome TaxID=652676 RepID=A0A3B1BQQ5_9ZZZZ